MKKILLFLAFFALIFTSATAQQNVVIKASEDIIKKENKQVFSPRSEFLTKRCTDTIAYPQGKTSSYRGLYLNAGSAQALTQYYEIPQDVTIYGFEFFANQASANPPGDIDLICNLYKAAGSSLPSGTPLRTVTVPVKRKAGSSLSNFRYEAIFDKPISVDYPVILSVETNTSLNVALYTNDFEVSDGDGEFLASGKLNGTWYPGSSITISLPSGTVYFDADVILQPFVQYDAVSDFSLSKHCIEAGDTIEITNHSSSIYDSRFFNQTAFNDPNNSGETSFQWSFTQGIPGFIGYDTSFVVQTKNGHRIQMTATIDKWQDGQCVAVIRDSVDQEPVADFEKTSFSGSIHFWNHSIGLGASEWHFDDGTFTRQKDPSYYFITPGDHDVTLIVKNGCSADTMTKTIYVHPVGIDNPDWADGIKMYPVPANNIVNISFNSTVEMEQVVIYDLSGRLVGQENISGHSGQITIDLTGYAAGNYIVKIKSKNTEAASYKLVKE